MIGEPGRPHQAVLLAGVGDKDQRTLGPLFAFGERFGELEDGNGAGSVVIGAIADRIGPGLMNRPQAVEDDPDLAHLLGSRLTHRTVGSQRPHDPVEGADRIVVHRIVAEADVVVVRSE